MQHRPDNVRLNRNHPWAKNLVYAGIATGAFVGGTLWPDLSRWSRHSALTNMAIASSWRRDAAIERASIVLAGTDDHAVLASGLVSGAPLTMCCWVNPTAVASGQVAMFLGQQTDNNNKWYLGFGVSGSGSVDFVTRDTSNGIATVASAISANAWTHIGGTTTGAASRAVWVNGISRGTNTTSIAPSAPAYFYLGRQGSGSYMTGSIGDTLVFDTAMTGAEMSEIGDRGNTMISGLLLPPRRKWWPVVSAAPPASTARNLVLGGGVL